MSNEVQFSWVDDVSFALGDDDDIVAEEVALLAHAIGYMQRPGDEPPATLAACHRNNFAAGKDHAEAWDFLAARGLAELVRGPVEGVFPEPLYRVTPAGFELVRDRWRRSQRSQVTP